MNRKILFQFSSITSLIVVLVLDARTPLGFAHGDLYLFSIVLATLSGSRRLLTGVAVVSVLLTALGIVLSPVGLTVENWLPNRIMSMLQLAVISALLHFVLTHYQRLRKQRSTLENTNQQLRELTPSPDNPLAPFRYLSQFQLFADAIPQIIWTADPDGFLDYVNLAFARYTGRSRDTLAPGTGWLRTVSPDDIERVLQRWQDVIEDQQTYEMEFRLQRHDGVWRWHLIQGAPVRDENNDIIKWCGSAIDIHDIRTYAERFENVAKATVDAIWDWDIENSRIWWNHGISTLFGHDRDEMMSEPAAWVKHAHSEDREHVLQTIYNTINSDSNFMNISYRFHRADGSIAQIDEHSFVMRNKDGKALRMVGGMTDVTERHVMAEQLSHAQRLQTVGELTGGVAHDFNNLLTVIQGNNELLAEALTQDPRLTSLTSMISQASERAASLVQHLLAFARKQPLDPQAIDVGKLIHNIQPLIRRAIPERIRINVVISADLPDVMIDPAQLENALLNLCLNARDAISEQGELLLEASLRTLDQHYCQSNQEAEPGDYVLVSVTDTGNGMTSAVQQRAFDPFFTTKDTGLGSGLGLSMVYGFIKQSGGHIAIHSEQDAGTVMRMYLPVVDTHESARRNGPGRRQQSAKISPTVLLVEDDELVRHYAKKQFTELGYTVISASNGLEALSLLNSHEPVDLLFTDVMMSGGMNGPELANAALEIRPQLPVLFTSGYSDSALSHQGRLQAGAILLSKPWRRDDLAQKLETIMSIKQ